MWLQLIALAAAAPAVEEAGARVDTYADGWITVVAPSAHARARVSPAWTVGLAYTADAVTGATPLVTADAISSATTFTDLRHAPAVDVALATSDAWQARASWSTIVEADYDAHVAGLGASADALDRMATLRADYRARFEAAGRADDAGYREPSLGHTLDLAWTQILGRATTATVLVTGQWDDCSPALGCQANPYRRVLADGVALAELHPDTRGRAAAAVRFSQGVGASTAVHGGYRWYGDTWAVRGHTADVTVAQALLDGRLELRATGRLAAQDAASFWRASYAGTPRWRTGDRELGRMVSGLAGGSAEWSFFGVGPLARLGLAAHVRRLWYRYPDDAYVPTRDAWLMGGGVDAEF